jgi:hypothetical protein
VLTAVVRTLLEEPFPRDEAERNLRESGDDPPDSLDLGVHTANRLLRGEQVLAGGLGLQDDLVTWSWAGIWCDARIALHAVDEAERLEAAGLPDPAIEFRRALDAVAGVPLPGEEGDAEALRGVLATGLVRAAGYLRERRQVTAEDRIRWLEGAGRLGALELE